MRTLVDAPLDPGEYIVFWDGKNSQKQTLPSGTYICRFLAAEATYEIEMSGKQGGKGVSADSSAYFPSNPLHFSLEQNFPNPFFMSNGTNIPFTLPYSAHIQLTIHKKE